MAVPSRDTFALVRIEFILTGAVLTLVGDAIVRHLFAVGSTPPAFALTGVRVLSIKADGAILTGVVVTVIVVNFTAFATPARLAVAFITGDFVDAGAAVSAFVVEAIIIVDFTSSATKTGGAGTLEIVNKISAVAFVLAGGGIAVINILVTVLTVPPCFALT